MKTNQHGSRPRRLAGLAAAGLSAALVMAGCDAGGAGTDGPIVLGGVFSKTPVPFGADAEDTAMQVFKNVNADGGIDGRKIKYTTSDDQADTTKAGSSARDAVSDDAVAMVGSASFVDCGTNKALYHQKDIMSIQAVGVDPTCFNSPDIASVTISPYTQLTAQLYYASKELDDSNVCLFQPTTPGSKDAIENAIKRWKDITGNSLLIDDHSIPQNQTKFTNELLRAKSKKCDAIVYGGGDNVAAPMLKNAANQGMDDVDFLYVSVAYTKQLANAASDLDMNVYATSGTYPFTEDDETTKEWRETAEQAGADQTSFSEAGYIAAHWIVHVLRSMDEPITRDSVTKALRDGGKYDSDLVPTPLVFGSDDSHDRATGMEIMTLEDGKWERAKQLDLPDAAE